MGVVLEVQLMHRAPNMAVSRDWSLQHVEVAHEGSGRTFYFMAGEWVGEAWILWRLEPSVCVLALVLPC